MAVLVTGAAGFIGYHVAEHLLARGEAVLGVDDLNDYYDVRLKHARLERLRRHSGFHFARLDLADAGALAAAVAASEAAAGIDRIVHLAAQAGVRYSLDNPFAYARANVTGHLAVLEAARHMRGLRHLVYASSSSVYGASRALPFREDDRADTPLSLYAATKRADELMAHAYAHLFGIPMSGLRFFTVYGPWGRPDMAYFSFAEAIMQGAPITVFDGGVLRRDFTYIDDIVAGVVGCLDHPPDAVGGAPAPRLFNIGNTASETVATLIACLERALGRRAVLREAPRPAADVTETLADVSALAALTGFAPRTPLAAGIGRFAAWFLEWRASRDGGERRG
jgi:UDP-glucuronate 4-epimerase